MAKQCPRCGRVMNLEERRCPGCLASLSNERIGSVEVAAQQLKEVVAVERANLWNRHVRRGTINGAIIPVLLILTLKPILVVVGIPLGAATGWLVAWRHWGSGRACAVFSILMGAPLLFLVAFNPYTIFFAFLIIAATGGIIGIAITSTLDT